MTETALAVKDEFKITADDVRKYIAPNATEKEFGILMGICKSHRLNPFIREVHFVKYGNGPANIITGYEVYLKRAERTGKLDGWKCWIESDKIGEKAVVEIKRKDQSTPFRWEAYRKEFDKGQSTWKSMPYFMLKKVAISQAFRICFSEDLGGLPYTAEEMPIDKGGGVSEALPVEAIEAEPSDVPEPEPMDNYVYPAHCNCGWIGMADDCSQHRCPNCGDRVIKDKDIEVITDKQQKRLFARAKATGWPNAELKAYLQEVHGISSTKDIPSGLYDKIIAHIDSHTGYSKETYNAY